MKDRELQLQETEAFNTLRGSIYTLIHQSLVSTGLVAFRGPMYLSVCVSEKRGDGEGAGSYTPSDTLGYIDTSISSTGYGTLETTLHTVSTITVEKIIILFIINQ